MSRIGSRIDPLVAALLAGADAGAFSLPATMIEGRDRLASLRAVVAAQTPPLAEQTARRGAVLALMADPAADVVGPVLAARTADAEHQMRVDLLREAHDAAADQADVLPDDWGTHLLRAFDDCITRLTASYAVFSVVSASGGDALWNAPKRVRDAWSEFCRAVRDHEAIRSVWRIVRAGSPSLVDHEDLFAETTNLDVLWSERVQGLRPISTMKAPWPPRSDALAWTLWMIGHGAVLHLPSVEQQDSAWNVIFGERSREFAAGGRYVAQMRELFG